LFQAASGGELETVRSLIADGANVNAKDPEQETPLMYAAAKGRAEIVKLLIHKGADLSTGQKMNRNPLYEIKLPAPMTTHRGCGA
jgi:ankyrin repeat protein